MCTLRVQRVPHLPAAGAPSFRQSMVRILRSAGAILGSLPTVALVSRPKVILPIGEKCVPAFDRSVRQRFQRRWIEGGDAEQ